MSTLSHITDKSGIYKITSPSGKVYIGESNSIRKRIIMYKYLKCKRQFKLYNSLRKYGFENHIVEVIEECDFDDLLCRERYWQDFYDVMGDKGLNLILTRCGDKKQVISKETANRRDYSNMSKGKKHTYYGKFGADHPAHRSNRTDESRRVQSEMIRLGKNPSAKIVIDTQTGIFYECAKELAIIIGMSASTLRAKLNGYRKNNTPYIYC